MVVRKRFLAQIEAYLTRTGMTERAFGDAVANDHKFVSRLRDGVGVTLTSLERAEHFMATGKKPKIAKRKRAA